ncbi:MAG: TonB-dependent receptor [Acidobacteriota bacterium]
MRTVIAVCAVLCLLALPGLAQVTTGEILGVVQDPTGAAVADAKITARNLETNATREMTSGIEGRFRFPQLPVGSYQVTVEKSGFARYVQGPIGLMLNQDADLQIKLQVAGLVETVTVSTDAPLINTTNAEVGVNFDTRRVSDLPLSTDRNILNLALSVPGVSQISSGQSSFAAGGVNFSVNGMRLRSNNFMLDGQDSNDPSVTGLSQVINNPDMVAEFRLITSQFAPEYGRTAGSVVNIITKRGTNEFHGSAFWFHNDNHLNSRSNLDKAPVGTPPRPKFASAPFRIENQFGGTAGGPILKDKTFFFGSLQRWTDRQLGSGTTIRGVPTEEGRQTLQRLAGSRPPVQALLEHLPAAQAPVAGLSAPLTVGGQSVQVPLGTLSGATSVKFDNWQWSSRLDHRFNDKHSLGGRYLYNDQLGSGSGQATPPGLTTVVPTRRQAASAALNSSFSPTMFNELRLSWQRFGSTTTAQDPKSERIPNIEVPELGLTGFNAAASRTAIGLALNLPQFRFNNNYQIQETLGWLRGSHSMKFGIDFRRQDVKSLFIPNIRGRLAYNTLQDLVDDVAQTASINAPLPGGERLNYYKYDDYFFFLQDEWRIRPRFTITYGVRYESPGNPIENLRQLNERILSRVGGNPGYALTPMPKRDNNNWAPRFGFNYRLPKAPAALGWLTGNEQLVLRGGYSRTYDFAFINIALNIFSAFPFVNVVNLPARTPNSMAQVSAAGVNPPAIANPYMITRTVVGGDFRAPYAEQFALQLQRELRQNWALTIGWIGTKGSALYQTIDGNPTLATNNNRGTARVDPTRGIIRLRANAASSIYHSLQTSLEKRYSQGLTLAAHYTWSAYIDDASEIFNPSVSGEVAVSQDSYNRRADRGRSTYDRPHRFTTNAVYELPFLREQKGAAGKILGGWQVSPFFTLQAGAPFTALDGADPGFRLSGIDALVGNAIRANVNTSLDLTSMSVQEIYREGGAKLFSRVTAASPLGNVGRNALRADGIANLGIGFIKNTRVSETNILQFRAEFYNATNSRDFGIAESRVSSANFLNQWGQDGGNRRILLGLRYTF